VRTGIGRKLDQEIAEQLDPVFAGTGFVAIKRKREWRRTGSFGEQVDALWVDGRTAREGSMGIQVDYGLTYPWETPDDQRLIGGGSSIVAHGDFKPVRLGGEQDWRYTLPGSLRGLRAFLESWLIPAMDEFQDPRRLRDHYISIGHLRAAIELSVALEDLREAAVLLPAFSLQAVRRVRAEPVGSPGIATAVLDLAQSVGAEIDPDDRPLLIEYLRDSIDRWRAGKAGLQQWVLDAEARYL
jgi:hypothetical protein